MAAIGQVGLAGGHVSIPLRRGLRARQSRELAIAQRGGLVTRQRRAIASSCNRIASGARLDALLGALLAFLRAATAKVARDVAHPRVAAVHEVAIAGFLIAIGRGLIAVGRSLVVVGPRLISIGERLIALRERLIILERL